MSPANLVDSELATLKDGAEVDGKARLRREHFALGEILPEPLPGESEDTDTTTLRSITRSVAALDLDDFFERSLQLRDALEQRSRLFGDPEFTDKRFSGWCQALNSLGGAFHYGNRYFLYKQGRFVDEPEFLDSLYSLFLRGVSASSVPGEVLDGPAAWCSSHGSPHAMPRLRLALALSYIMREAAVINAERVVARRVDEWADENFDVLVLSAGYGEIKLTSRDNPWLVRCRGACRELIAFFGPAGQSRALMRVPYRTEPALVASFNALLRASQHVGLTTEVAALLGGLGLSADEVSKDTALGSERHRMAAYLRATRPIDGVASDETVELPKVVGKGSRIGSRLEVSRELFGLGSTQEALQCFPKVDEISRLSLSTIHSYMSLAPSLLPRVGFPEGLSALRECLKRLSRRHLGEVNLLARLIQFDTLVDDHFSMEHSRLALRRTGFENPPEETKDVVILYFDQDRVGPGLLAPLMAEMATKAVTFYSLQQRGIGEDIVPLWPHSPVLNETSSAVVGCPIQSDELFNDWQIDLDSGVLTCDGANYYQGMYERVGRVLKVFHVQWELPSAQTFFLMWLRKIDRVVFALKGVEAHARARGMRVRLVSLQGHFVPYFALKTFAEHHSDVIEHVTLSSSYENWKSNMSGEPLGTLTALNNTYAPGPSMPAFGTRVGFESWFQNEFAADRSRWASLNDDLTGTKRSGTSEEEQIQRVREFAATGAHVFCALGKIPYDLAVPSQHGPAHSDMADWISHTVSTVNNAPSSVLIVKPHPHELNFEISGKPIEGFVDLLPQTNPERVMVLPHRGVSLQDLRGIVDTFLCWNGSSITEIGSWGEKIVASDYWAHRNYPVGVCQPVDRSAYEALLRGEEEVTMAEDFRERCIAYNCYLTEAPFALPYPYTVRSSNNTNFNQSAVNFTALAGGGLEVAGEWAYERFYPDKQ